MPPKTPKNAKHSARSRSTSKGHPDDIIPMVLTSATQELFGCLADEDLTGDSPYKLLKKDDIIQDIKTRAAVSDFSPVKQIVLDYPEDELLLVFDRDFTYDQSFYLVITLEAKARLLNPPESETVLSTAENEVSKTPEPKPWISLHSEQEIEEEYTKETRKKLCYKLCRVRRKFGQPFFFSDRNAADAKHGYVECPSYKDSRFSIKLMQRDCGIQAVPRLQSSSAQTQWTPQRNSFTQYVPREFSDEEKENILQSKGLKMFLNTVTPRLWSVLQQAEIMDPFSDDMATLGSSTVGDDWGKKASKNLMPHQVFAYSKYTEDRTVSSISWHPSIHGVLAVALAEKRETKEEQSGNSNRPSVILFYSFSDPCNPQLVLECPDDIFAFKFCPSDPNIIVGGCINGQVVLWDISADVTHLEGTQPAGKNVSDTFDLDDSRGNKTPVVPYCAMSGSESRHKAPITDVQWLPPTFEVTRTGLPVENMFKVSVQFISCSLDGTLMFWDLRVQKQVSRLASDRKHQNGGKDQKMSPTFRHLDRMWKPLFRVSLSKINSSEGYVPLKFSLEPYTSSANNREAVNEADDRSEVRPSDYSQMTVPLEKTPRTLEDVNTKLFVGTVRGDVIYIDWRLEQDDSGRLQSPQTLFSFGNHYWMVTMVERSPFYKDIILTSGGFNFAIWKEGLMDGPIIMSPNMEDVFTAMCWSLSWPSVFFAGRQDGSIEMWNLLQKTNAPAHVQTHVTNTKITGIKARSSTKQQFLAVSDDQGIVRVLEIPKAFYCPSRDESGNFRKYLKLEENKLTSTVKREEPSAEQEEEAEEFTKKGPSKLRYMEENEEENKKEYNDYLKLKGEVLKGLGLFPADAQKM